MRTLSPAVKMDERLYEVLETSHKKLCAPGKFASHALRRAVLYHYLFFEKGFTMKSIARHFNRSYTAVDNGLKTYRALYQTGHPEILQLTQKIYDYEIHSTAAAA